MCQAKNAHRLGKRQAAGLGLLCLWSQRKPDIEALTLAPDCDPHREALPRQLAIQQEHEGIGQGLKIIPPADRPAEVRMH